MGDSEPISPAKAVLSLRSILDPEEGKRRRLDPSDVQKEIRELNLHSVELAELQTELRTADATLIAHLADMEQRKAAINRRVAYMLALAGTLAVFMGILVHQNPGSDLPLVVGAPLAGLIAALSIVGFFLQRSRVESETIAEIRKLQIVGSVIRQEITGRRQ